MSKSNGERVVVQVQAGCAVRYGGKTHREGAVLAVEPHVFEVLHGYLDVRVADVAEADQVQQEADLASDDQAEAAAAKAAPKPKQPTSKRKA